MIKITPHPAWVVDLLESVRPLKERVVNHKIFSDICQLKLTIAQFQRALVNFYPLIESFPKFMSLNLTKVPLGGTRWNKKTKYWLIVNINQERLHAGWWRDFAFGFGVAKEVLDKEIHPPPAVDALNNYLWRVCTYGSLAEGIGASNFAVEGPTGEWTKITSDYIRKYQGKEGTRITDKTFEWVTAHANYDDKHPYEALEILKAYATTPAEQEKVRYAIERSLEYYAMALDACYE
ncbi:MAG: iron-containing redox enzyme family protein [Acidobacteria bacterium]|nr:iron-containing redox enzyme family protein [Acidobacteriota bacterium]